VTQVVERLLSKCKALSSNNNSGEVRRGAASVVWRRYCPRMEMEELSKGTVMSCIWRAV
jgi:hypothetical protein